MIPHLWLHYTNSPINSVETNVHNKGKNKTFSTLYHQKFYYFSPSTIHKKLLQHAVHLNSVCNVPHLNGMMVVKFHPLAFERTIIGSY